MGVPNKEKKTVRFSIFILILIILLLALNNTVLADNKAESGPISIKLDEDVIIEIDKVILSDYTQITVPPDTNVVIKYPKNDITIIPPAESIITSISNTSLHILTEDGTKTIHYQDSITAFSAINFYSSIDGLDDFNLKVSYIDPNGELNLTRCKINWGDDQVSVFEGVFPSIISHTYNKEGEYTLEINLTDSDGTTYTLLKNQTFDMSTGEYIGFWIEENDEEIATSTAGITGLTLLCFALTETGKYKILSFLLIAIPLYVHQHKEDVLDQFVRGKIYGYIKGNPGVHYNQIIRELDMRNGTLSYHLHVLEKTGLIKSRKEGIKYRAFYSTETSFPEKERYRLTELQLKIIEIIKEKSGISQKEIAKTLNEKHQTINYNIKVLQQANIIDSIKKGRKTKLYLTESDPSIS